jgi:hypothetical protein
VPGFSECATGDGGNVADIYRADTCVADGRDELPLLDDHRLECQKALEVQVGTEEREADTELANASFNRRVVAKKAHGRPFVGGEL